jgi:hypothetical protein
MLAIKRLALAALCALAIPSAVDAAPKTLHWSRLAVTARLDADGRLHVQERHSIVFNGEWNGGERRFPQRLENVIHLERISRVDPSGVPVPLHEDTALSDVDAYAWTGGQVLRWRSRLPTDPPFDQREITYLIEYTDSKILIPSGGSYLLDHNFGLPNLEWPIDAYSVDLSLDPVWEPLEPLPAHLTRANLPRGENVTVTSHLRHTGSTPPAAVNLGAPASLRYAMLALLLGASAGIAWQFLRRERAIGRFAPSADPATIDRAWLEAHVLKFPPEVVGAAWDDRTDAAEVAAVIARLVQEGKMSSRVEKRGPKGEELVLTLLRPKNSFSGYEESLVKALFFEGNTTSTDRIKAHYKSKGFDPVSKIRGRLEKEPLGLAGRNAAPRVTRTWTLGLASAGALLVVVGGFMGVLNVIGALVACSTLLALYVAGVLGAMDYRRRVTRTGLFTLEFVPAALLILVVPAFLLVQWGGFRFHPALLAGLVLLSIAAIRSIFNAALSRDTGEYLQYRRRLAAAREFFAGELRRPNPALDDSWFPYVLAFGLGADADRWFRSFGGSSTAASPSTNTFGSSSGSHSPVESSGSRTTGWTGAAGGASGGAGASGTWAVAAAEMAAGVSSPSTSSSGSSGGSSGGGSSSGGSSGGGGGGGW